MSDFTKEMQMVLYTSSEGDVSVDAYIHDETIWITQKAMAELFGIDKSGISRHLKHIFETKELDETMVVAKNATTTQHGAIQDKTQTTDSNFYNLDAIISVGYRVNSKKATNFRIWATQILKEYIPHTFIYLTVYRHFILTIGTVPCVYYCIFHTNYYCYPGGDN